MDYFGLTQIDEVDENLPLNKRLVAKRRDEVRKRTQKLVVVVMCVVVGCSILQFTRSVIENWVAPVPLLSTTTIQAARNKRSLPACISETEAQQLLVPPRFLAPGILGERAIPTNAWWGNLIASSSDRQVQPVWSNPYSIRPSLAVAPYGLSVNYPYRSRAFGGRSGNGRASKYYLHGSLNEFTFSALEFHPHAPMVEVFDWDDLGVKMRIYSSSDMNAFLQTELVSGMAYISAKYENLTPHFVSIYAITSINGVQSFPGMNVHGDRFAFSFNSGEQWILYFTAPVSIRLEGFTKLLVLDLFSGTARIAVVPIDEAVSLLDTHKECQVTGGLVSVIDETEYSFEWNTMGNCTNGLLHYGQSHHIQTLRNSTESSVHDVSAYSTTRGKMYAIVTKGSSFLWRFHHQEEIPVGFYPKERISVSMAQELSLYRVLRGEIYAPWKNDSSGSYYFNGKLAQKYASLCLIANVDEIVPNEYQEQLRSECISKLQNYITVFLDNRMKYPLVFDSVYRGIVSSEGSRRHDPGADFGNTMYNDHHFHYGYWIMTAAIANHLSPTWSRLVELNELVDALVLDVANPTQDEHFFPRYRSFDWFRGHSYSHGVVPFADGKDEESSSEDINFHYAMMLYGQARRNPSFATTGKLMLKLNALAVQTYFLLTNANTIHPEQFRPNKVTGILFDNKVDYSTWFSPEKYCIHGIQMIPITPITEFVRLREFVQEEWDEVLMHERIIKEDDLGNSWMSILYANYATVDKQVALQKLKRVALDDGLSRSWALYIAATRPNSGDDIAID